MNDELEPMLPAAPATRTVDPDDVEVLDRDVGSLRGTVFALVLGLLMLAVAFDVFLVRQVQIVRRQLDDERREIAEYQKAEPAVHDLFRRLQAFAASHPDFQPIMARYAPAASSPAKR